MKIKNVCVLGGTGFVGGHLVARLTNAGYLVKILTRRRERHKQFLVTPSIALVEADVRDDDVLRTQFAGCDAVINLVGILNGTEQAFRAIHAELPRRVMEACRHNEVPRLLHMSALNADADSGPSNYLRTKGEGEQAALSGGEYGIQVTAFRPSIIFGPDDSFFNLFAGLLKLSPVLPLACPQARFAPVYVNDVVSAFEIALLNEATFGQSLELCGPRIYTFKELVDATAKMIDCKRLVWGLPDALARLQARVFEFVPGQPFTRDNYQSLQVDSVCRRDDMATLGITPTSVEAIMPQHFADRSGRSRYSSFRKMSRR